MRKDPPKPSPITGLHHATKRALPQWLIDGKYYSLKQLAAELGVSEDTADRRFRAARKLPGPVTLERLRGTKRAAKTGHDGA